MKLSRIGLLISTLMLSASACGGSDQQPVPTNDTQNVDSQEATTVGASGDLPTVQGAAGIDGAYWYTDPQGFYSLAVSQDWVQVGAPQDGTEAWQVASTENENAPSPNVNIQTLPLGSELSDDDLTQFVIDDLGTYTPSFELVAAETVIGSDGQMLAVITYRGVLGDEALEFLSVATNGGDNTSIATLTVPSGHLDSIRTLVEPNLLTIAALN